MNRGLRTVVWLVALILSAGCAVLWAVARWRLGRSFSDAFGAEYARYRASTCF